MEQVLQGAITIIIIGIVASYGIVIFGGQDIENCWDLPGGDKPAPHPLFGYIIPPQVSTDNTNPDSWARYCFEAQEQGLNLTMIIILVILIVCAATMLAVIRIIY